MGRDSSLLSSSRKHSRHVSREAPNLPMSQMWAPAGQGHLPCVLLKNCMPPITSPEPSVTLLLDLEDNDLHGQQVQIPVLALPFTVFQFFCLC